MRRSSGEVRKEVGWRAKWRGPFRHFAAIPTNAEPAAKMRQVVAESYTAISLIGYWDYPNAKVRPLLESILERQRPRALITTINPGISITSTRV